MNSQGHRENLLDPYVDSVAVSVIRKEGQLYAVQDFERSVAELSYSDQENLVAARLHAIAPVQLADDSTDARRTCEMESGFAGSRRPVFVMRYSGEDLNRLPEALQTKLASGRYREVAIGACALRSRQDFSAYNIAVLLYP